jgi:putative ABC transport system substrate-binding protein
MKRREFITLLGSAAAFGPLASRAQQPERVRRIGSLNVFAETDPEARSWDAAFRQRLDELGWVDGRNIHFDYHWGAGSVERLQMSAKQLVQLAPDVILSVGTPATAVLQAETHKIPIVFASVSDPVGSGLVASLANPGGNITGFINLESSLSSKWLELMHAIAPHVSRAAFMFNPRTAPYARHYLAIF